MANVKSFWGQIDRQTNGQAKNYMPQIYQWHKNVLDLLSEKKTIQYHYHIQITSIVIFYAGIINPFPNKPWFLHVCSTSPLKTLWEKEKLLVTSNFSFSRSIF